MKPDVAGLVDTVDVTEAGGNGEVGGDGGESRVDIPDVLRLRVERVVVYILVVHAVLLTTSDTCRLLAGCMVGMLARGSIPISISSHCFMGAARLRYLFRVAC